MQVGSGQLRPATVRRVVATICAGAVASMIAAAATRHLGPVITLGSISTAAIITLIAVFAVSPPPALALDAEQSGLSRAHRVEELVATLQGHSVEEVELRALVGEAVQLGRELAARDVRGEA